MIHNIGVVGVGVWGCHSLERELVATGRARVKSICSDDRFGAHCHGANQAEAVKSYASEMNAESVVHWEDVIADPEIDIVSVMVCPKEKSRIVAAALAHGKTVITDKPLGISSAALEEIRNAPGFNPEGIFMLAGYWNRPGTARILSIAEAGKMGRILTVSIRLNFMGGIYPGFVPTRRWRQEIPSGEMTTIGSHAIVTALKFIQSKPCRVYALSRNFFYPEYEAVGAEDWADMNVAFADGAVANISVGRTPYRIPGEDIILEVTGSDGYAILHGRKLEIYIPGETVREETAPYAPKDTFNDWLDRLEQGRPSPVNFTDAMTLQRIIDAGIDSSRKACPVEIP